VFRARSLQRAHPELHAPSRRSDFLSDTRKGGSVTGAGGSIVFVLASSVRVPLAELAIANGLFPGRRGYRGAGFGAKFQRAAMEARMRVASASPNSSPMHLVAPAPKGR
jgi:hypothetical protein